MVFVSLLTIVLALVLVVVSRRASVAVALDRLAVQNALMEANSILREISDQMADPAQGVLVPDDTEAHESKYVVKKSILVREMSDVDVLALDKWFQLEVSGMLSDRLLKKVTQQIASEEKKLPLRAADPIAWLEEPKPARTVH
jgi:hypothetical protein